MTLKRLRDPAADEAALGLKRWEMELVQRGLAESGFAPGEIDGRIGGDTRKALRAWQAEQGHEETGHLTADEARALMAAAREWPGHEFEDCDACPTMVVVPAGEFRMGSPSSEEGHPNEGPQHRVTIPEPFAVGKYEVTFSEWGACVSAGGCGGYQPDDRGWGRGQRPAINVSWRDAKAYVAWLSDKTGEQYRLLSEAEWEYAARAATTGPFHFGSTISTDQANYNGNNAHGSGRKGVYRKKTVPVGSFAANGFGLHDVHGNVWEWVEDCWHGSYAGAPTDGRARVTGGGCDRRILRGGSWNNGPGNLRSALRVGLSAENRDVTDGFRVSRTLTP